MSLGDRIAALSLCLQVRGMHNYGKKVNCFERINFISQKNDAFILKVL